MADMRPGRCCVIAAAAYDASLLRRMDILPELPVQQHVPLWKMLPVPHDGILTNRAPRGARFFS